MKRDDVKALATWIVFTWRTHISSLWATERFFEATTAFLNDLYGQENAVAAVVHYDETAPHLRYAFFLVFFILSPLTKPIKTVPIIWPVDNGDCFFVRRYNSA